MKKFDFYSSYHQFYICDKESEMETGSDNFWTDESVALMLAVEEGVLGVGTACYGYVKGEIELLEIENKRYNSDAYDHIVEAGLHIKSGVIQIQNCPDSSVEVELNVKPGFYKFRVYGSGFDTVVGDDGDDYYRIEVWSDENTERKVIKQIII